VDVDDLCGWYVDEASSAKLVLSPLRVEVGLEEDRDPGCEVIEVCDGGGSPVEETLWVLQVDEDIISCLPSYIPASDYDASYPLCDDAGR
jgi:hypothetical protein